VRSLKSERQRVSLLVYCVTKGCHPRKEFLVEMVNHFTEFLVLL